MRLLVDTHLLLWSAVDAERLPKSAEALLTDPANELLFSVVSLWEIAIKRGLERDDFDADPRALRGALLDTGFRELPVSSEHALSVQHLPRLHKDPFDRLLLAQAIVENARLLTSDRVLARYAGPVRTV